MLQSPLSQYIWGKVRLALEIVRRGLDILVLDGTCCSLRKLVISVSQYDDTVF